jgi:hypothetical protein
LDRNQSLNDFPGPTPICPIHCKNGQLLPQIESFAPSTAISEMEVRQSKQFRSASESVDQV